MNVVLCILVVLVQSAATYQNLAKNHSFANKSEGLAAKQPSISSIDNPIRFNNNSVVENTIDSSEKHDVGEKIDAATTSSKFELLTGAALENDLETYVENAVKPFVTNETPKEVINMDVSNVDAEEDKEISEFPFTGTTVESSTVFAPDCSINNSPIEIIQILPSSFSVTLQFSNIDTNDCQYEYTILLNDNKNHTIDSPPNGDIYFTVDNLYACSNYNVSIAASYDFNIVSTSDEKAFQTTFPADFSNYTKLDLKLDSISGDSFNVTWSQPQDNILQCVTEYYLLWREVDTINSGDDVVINVGTNFWEIPLYGCLNYTIQIIPRGINNTDGMLTILEYNAEPLPNALSRRLLFSGKTDVNITWEIDTKNKCPLEEIVVECEAPTDLNGNLSWIVWHQRSVLPISTVPPDPRYRTTVANLSPFTNYTCGAVVVNSAGNSSVSSVDFRTSEDITSEPLMLTVTNIQAHSFDIEWQEPEKVPGIMTSYGLFIQNNGPLHPVSLECQGNATDHYFNRPANANSFRFEQALAYYSYNISVFGIDGAGNGSRALAVLQTQASVPDPVSNPKTDVTYPETEAYTAVVKITFDRPCNTNGPFKHYVVTYTGVRENHDSNTGVITSNEPVVTISTLLAERHYRFGITVVTDGFNSSFVEAPELVTKAGVPPLRDNFTAPRFDGANAVFNFTKNGFSDENGDIVAYALILSTGDNCTDLYGFWNGVWPKAPQCGTQLTPDFWQPFSDGADHVVLAIGSDSCKILKENTDYYLLVRALTKVAYKDGHLLHFYTEMNIPDEGWIIGLIIGLLLLIIITLILVFLWRRKRGKSVEIVVEKKYESLSAYPVPVAEFNEYYNNIKDGFLVKQYHDISLYSQDIAGPTSVAILSENMRKNRYTNILPFDNTRVTLQNDGDDEITSDYINASYIKGYSGQIEYIATQGPLKTTTREFWTMVLQENVSIIAMVSNFFEQGKEKCYHYFPKNHQSACFGEDLEVKCTTELHFGTYCIRTLQVRKGTEQRDVIHMQFLEWPDFGVPRGTVNMLQFCNQLREKVAREGGLIVVHCSAGVGRTGTLIALDILLQTIDDQREINVYKTVLDLRRQRINMVQTEHQYAFLYACVIDYINTPKSPLNEKEERVYENMEEVKSSLKNNLINDQIESAL